MSGALGRCSTASGHVKLLVDDMSKDAEPVGCMHFRGDASAGFAVARLAEDGEDCPPKGFGRRAFCPQLQAGSRPCHSRTYFRFILLAASGDDG